MFLNTFGSLLNTKPKTFLKKLFLCALIVIERSRFLKELCIVFTANDLYSFVHNNNLIIRYFCCCSLLKNTTCDCHWLFQREHGQQICQEEDCYWSNLIIDSEYKINSRMISEFSSQWKSVFLYTYKSINLYAYK